MSSAATMAHIHNGPPAQPGPVVAALTATAGTSGKLSAEIELTDEQVAALKANAYTCRFIAQQTLLANSAAGCLRSPNRNSIEIF
jgi:hypothetical protein